MEARKKSQGEYKQIYQGKSLKRCLHILFVESLQFIERNDYICVILVPQPLKTSFNQYAIDTI